MTMPMPIGLQKEVLALPTEGHYVVLGTAGSGKSTMAIYRALFLSELNNKSKVLLVTFNKTLVKYLDEVSKSSLNNIDIVNYHKFARGYLNSVGKMGKNSIINSDLKRFYITKSIENVKESKRFSLLLFRESVDFYIEEIGTIQKTGINTLQEYVNWNSSAVTLAEKNLIFAIYDEYYNLRKGTNYKYDFEDIANYVLKELTRDKRERMYKHIIIDEGQDLSPVMLKSLIEAADSKGSVTYFGDVAQKIYQGDFTWRHGGLKNVKIWVFEQNYRNTIEIANLALQITKSPYYSDVADMVIPKSPIASGPLPVIVKCKKEEELNFLLTTIIPLGESETVGILVRNREQVKEITTYLNEKFCSYKILKGDMNKWIEEPTIYVGTIHSAKGLEFDVVCLPFCEQINYPYNENINKYNSFELACKEDIKLLYVGVTRAKRGLIISYSDNLTNLLPNNEHYKYSEVLYEQ